jgi:His/Glu/Gln/Arg/opine family amino acid ABC transporter permease subunit
MSVIEILVEFRQGLLSGLLVTMKLCLAIWTAGLLVGSALGVAGSRYKMTLGVPERFCSFMLSGVPILVLLFWLHYPLQEILGVIIDPFYTAVVALSLVNVFAVADIVRRVLDDFPEQYMTAAKVCGLSVRQKILRIQLPIVLRQVLPSILIIQVSMLQATLFASLISVDEIFRVTQRINAQIYQPVQTYSAIAVLFLVICLPLNGLAFCLRRRFTRDFSER